MSLRIGTRGSLLALAQTTMVADALDAAGYGPVTRHVLRTSGDRKQDTPAARVSDKREWVDTLEHALRHGAIDVALHSGKDVPADVLAGTVLQPVLHRELSLDLFIGRALDPSGEERLRFADVPQGATLGTASARRAAQLRRLPGGLATVAWHGNVPTRVRRLDEHPTLAGVVVACAGVDRLQQTTLHALRLDEVENLSPAAEAALMQQMAAVDALDLSQAHRFAPEELLPAMNQGILAAQARADRPDVRDALAALGVPAVAAAFWAERACVARLGADCRSAVGVYAEPAGDGRLRVRGRVLHPDGSACLEREATGPSAQPQAVGEALADALNAAGAQALLQAARQA